MGHISTILFIFSTREGAPNVPTPAKIHTNATPSSIITYNFTSKPHFLQKICEFVCLSNPSNLVNINILIMRIQPLIIHQPMLCPTYLNGRTDNEIHIKLFTLLNYLHTNVFNFMSKYRGKHPGNGFKTVSSMKCKFL